MKISWRRIVFFALLVFIVPYMIVYSVTKNNNGKRIQPALMPEVSGAAVVEQASQPDAKPQDGPITYITGHNKAGYTLLLYPDRKLQTLIPVARRISGYETDFEEALASLLDGEYAPPGLNKPAIRPGTQLLSVGLTGSTAIVDFNGQLLPAKAEAAVSSMILNTVTEVARQFPYEKLEIRVNGKRLITGPDTGLAENPVNLKLKHENSYVVYRPLLADGRVYLYPSNKAGKAAPTQVVNDFLGGLSKYAYDMYTKVYISPEVRLLSAEVQDGRVTLNFNRALQEDFDEFAKQFLNRQMAENFFFDALVLSLTQEPVIREVRFMVEGKPINSLINPGTGDYSFARPRNINPIN